MRGPHALGDYNTPTQQWHLSGELHAYRRHWWLRWRRRCDGCGRQQCEWAARHEAAQRQMDAASRPDGPTERDGLVLLLWRTGWPGALLIAVFLVVATSRWWA